MPNSQVTPISPTNSTAPTHETPQEVGHSSKVGEYVISMNKQIGTKQKGKRNRAVIDRPKLSPTEQEKVVKP